MTFFDRRPEFSKQLAVIDERGQAFTYQELWDQAGRVPQIIPERSLVFLTAQNTTEFLMVYLGLLQSRSVPILIPESISQERLDQWLSLYKPQFIFRERSLSPEVYSKETVELYDDLALLMTTSGSTGSPKMVRLSYGNLSSNAESIAQSLSISSQDRPLTTLSPAYAYGLSVINSHLVRGATLVLTTKSLVEKEFWNQALEHKVTSFAGVPYFYETWKRLGFNQKAMSCLRVATQAGGKLPSQVVSEVASELQQRDCQFHVMYGQTEATARMTCLSAETVFQKPGSVGRAIPGGAVSLEDGELVYRGPNVCLGYSQSHVDLGEGDQNLGVLKTGDLASIDEDGDVFIEGRRSRFAKIYGQRVAFDEVESLLSSWGLESACVGHDEKICVFVVAGEEQGSTLRKRLARETGLPVSVWSVVGIGDLPRLSSGKIDYQGLRSLCND